jgi:hypothetical protein
MTDWAADVTDRALFALLRKADSTAVRRGLWVGVLCCALTAVAGGRVTAQANSAAPPQSPPAQHLLYAELFGNALILGSINYEAMLTTRLSARVGASPFRAFPVMLNYLVPDGRHRLETGAGVLITSSGVAGTATIGYRRQPLAEGILLRVGLTPYVERGRVGWWAGLSVGAGR